MLHGLPNSSAWCVEFRACLVNVIRCESWFIGLCVCNFGELLSHIKPKSSLLSKSAKENSIMPQEFLLEPSRTQIWEGSNMWKQFLELCLQDAFKMNRDALAVSMWCFFDFVSGTPDSDHPETPEKEVGSSQRKPSTEWILQADSLACFGCIFFVAEFVAVFFQTRWKKDRNISEPLRSVWQVCENLLTAGALWNRGPQTRSKSASTMG